jgi:branched-chain amino acid transport system substrate-binding protein
MRNKTAMSTRLCAPLLAFSLVTTTSSAALGQTIKLGASIALSGSVAREGRLLKEGHEFWVDHVNKHGGILVGGKRHTVQIVFYDDESDPEVSARLTGKLIAEDKAQFLLGPYSSPITLETSLVSEKRRILTIASAANADAIYERRFKYVISVLPPASTYMNVFLEMASQLKPRPKTVAILAVGSAFGIQVAQGALDHAIRLGYEVLYFEKYHPGGKALATVLTQVKAKNPDVLVASSYFEEALLMVRQSKALKFCPKILAFTIGPDIPEFAKALGKDAEYVYGSAWWLPNVGWRDREFGSSLDYAQAMRKRTGREPSYFEAAGTAAGFFLQKAIEKANSLDTDAVRAAFATMDIESFWGPAAWNEKGQNIKGFSAPIQIQNGKVISIYPERVREAPARYPMPCWDKR